MKDSFRTRAALRLAAVVFRCVCATYRIHIVNPGVVREAGRKNFVLAFWHGSMVVGWFLHRQKKMCALVSQSKDGAVLSAILDSWGYTLIRGSSHRGGKEALQTMVDAVKTGGSLAVTPDGPTGPRRVMKIGAVCTAQRAGVALVPVSIVAKKKWQLRSWDRFEIPVPFSRILVEYVGPYTIAPELSGEPLNEEVRRIESEWIANENRLGM
jgi:lysophospholipid acyltransferase (LPLAT)-like uncharacterized protein